MDSWCRWKPAPVTGSRWDTVEREGGRGRERRGRKAADELPVEQQASQVFNSIDFSLNALYSSNANNQNIINIANSGSTYVLKGNTTMLEKRHPPNVA